MVVLTRRNQYPGDVASLPVFAFKRKLLKITLREIRKRGFARNREESLTKLVLEKDELVGGVPPGLG
jgi:hypothetical protein